ncbi:triadin-like isoform X3 [Pocillopora verrucosa]|uniref:triadin-like isoform X3 n=1 Tax=Pocillopora verrucosa TaxID=203993 RepID=UPI003341968E
MRKSVLLILLVLIAICAAKSSTNKKHKDEKSKKLKVTDTKKHKDEPKKHKTKNEHKDSSKKHLKDAKKKQDLKKKDEKPKISEDKAISKTANNKTEIVEKKENSTKAILSQNPPADCQNIIDDYSKGKLLMYEYKIQINRCMNKAKSDAAKKMQVPATSGYQVPDMTVQNYNMPAQQPEMPAQQAAFYYPNTAQTPYNGAPVQNPVPDQTQAAFAPNPTNQYPANPAPFHSADPNMAMNAMAKNTIPDAETQIQQPPASQANAVFDQWRASSFGAAAATKKDETPNAPEAPGNDQFAEFMKMQASTGNVAEASPISQQVAIPAAMQQRSDVPQQPNVFPAQAQLPNTVPGPSQAFYMQPEEHGDFPENP